MSIYISVIESSSTSPVLCPGLNYVPPPQPGPAHSSDTFSSLAALAGRIQLISIDFARSPPLASII